jgi:hypothetical protein
MEPNADDYIPPDQYTATASSSGYALTSNGTVVTATATATATASTYEEAYQIAFKEAQHVANATAQNDANLISQTIDIINIPKPNENTAYGFESLNSLQPLGESNSAFGYQTLYSNTDGGSNSAFGSKALYNNIGNISDLENPLGVENNAFGADALYSNTTGSENVAIGSTALYSNTSGLNNVALGNGALYFNTTGNYNTAVGDIAIYENTTGNYNTALGEGALLLTTTGSNNTVCGTRSFETNITGSNNTVVGYLGGVGTGGPEGYYDNKCTLIGGETSFLVPRPATTTYEYSTAIGYGSVIKDSHTIYLGTEMEKTVAVGGFSTNDITASHIKLAGQHINSAYPTVITSSIILSNFTLYKAYSVNMNITKQQIILPIITPYTVGMEFVFIILGGDSFDISSGSNLYDIKRTLQTAINVNNVPTISFISMPNIVNPCTSSSYAWFQL